MVAWVLVCAVVLILIMPPIAKSFNLPNNWAGAWVGGVIDNTGAVVAAGESVGAKDNWNEVYSETGETLLPGKEKWCIGCHDAGTSVVSGTSAAWTDVLTTGVCPIGIMAALVAWLAGERHVVLTDIAQDRLDLAGRIADITPVNTATTDLMDVRAQLGMREGFDIGMEMSGAPPAFSQMIEQMIMGGKIAVLGIPSADYAVDWEKIIFNMLTIRGVYGREMYETWYKMTVMIQSGLDVDPVITHRFHYTDFDKGFEVMRSGNSGKVSRTAST